jgi:Fe-S-cluster-containing dehydrogenase component/formate-dependent nitrite reductase membrane component NrfD
VKEARTGAQDVESRRQASDVPNRPGETSMGDTLTLRQAAPVRWAKVVDHARCIGCHACSTACKSENQVPIGVHRTYVKAVDVGRFPQARRAFQVTRCNQCAEPPCVFACPTAAMHQRADGIVDFDKQVCIGCKACIAACPYDAIFINPEDGAAEKCNFCAQRLDIGLEPACVVVCPTQAIVVGDLNDPSSRVGEVVGRDVVAVRRPEKETRPKLFYRGAHQATLDPLAARRPPGGLFMCSEQGSLRHLVTSGHPGEPNNAAAAILAYDVPHRAAWDWRVSLYIWTKGIAAGAYLVPALLLLSGLLAPESALWAWAAPIVAGAFLAATAGLLVSDLTHPRRFHMVLTRPQWRSWIARGGVVLSLYGALLGLHLLASALGEAALARWLVGVGLPLAVLSAVYTAWLFAQARGRDLWQSPLLPPQLLLQAVLAGASALLLLIPSSQLAAAPALAGVAAGATLLHLMLVAGEVTMTHGTAHARLAVWEMTSGRYRVLFRTGIALQGLGVAGFFLAPGAAVALPVLAGLLAYERAYVQAGQTVPLA